jgi:hypothetical protein
MYSTVKTQHWLDEKVRDDQGVNKLGWPATWLSGGGIFVVLISLHEKTLVFDGIRVPQLSGLSIQWRFVIGLTE